ncbi:unnamed protein product [Phytomonas sp. EM1]|nr:unnamed protein product [Phytomonas sp. EM1]|eukprot:CCW63975.1 unnamed protein product [Phytomonas sp. isolate EM1]
MSEHAAVLFDLEHHISSSNISRASCCGTLCIYCLSLRFDRLLLPSSVTPLGRGTH